MTGGDLKAVLNRLAALGLVAGLIAALYLVAVGPALTRIADLEAAIEAERALAARLAQAVASGGPAIDLAEIRRAQDGLFLDGESPAVMAARLQGMLHEFGDEFGWTLASTRQMRAASETGLTFIVMEARFATSLEGLQKTLLAIEAARPAILLTALQIAPVSARPGADDAATEKAPLSVRIEIRAASVPSARDSPGAAEERRTDRAATPDL